MVRAKERRVVRGLSPKGKAVRSWETGGMSPWPCLSVGGREEGWERRPPVPLTLRSTLCQSTTNLQGHIATTRQTEWQRERKSQTEWMWSLWHNRERLTTKIIDMLILFHMLLRETYSMIECRFVERSYFILLIVLCKIWPTSLSTEQGYANRTHKMRRQFLNTIVTFVLCPLHKLKTNKQYEFAIAVTSS